MKIKKPILDFEDMKRRSRKLDMQGYIAIILCLLMVNLLPLAKFWVPLVFLYVPLAMVSIVLMVKRAESMGELKAYKHINTEFHTMAAEMFRAAIANVADAAGCIVQEIAPPEMTKH